MKRTIQFKQTEAGYGCYENDEVVFEIKKSDLQFKVKEFYQAFYAGDKDFENITVENTLTKDKEAARVYECIQTIIQQVGDKLAELPEENEGKESLDDEEE